MRSHSFIAIIFVLGLFAQTATSTSIFEGMKVKFLEKDFMSQEELENKILVESGLEKKSNGMKCILCTALIFLWEQYSVVHYQDIDKFISHHACTFFDGPIRTACDEFVDKAGLPLLVFLYNSTSPDEACRKIKACTNPQCNLVKPGQFPNLKFSSEFKQMRSEVTVENSNEPLFTVEKASEFFETEEGSNFWKNIIKKIQDFLARFATEHKPDIDFDGDSFSSMMGVARGFHWRGKDCNDIDASVYPGRNEIPKGKS